MDLPAPYRITLFTPFRRCPNVKETQTHGVVGLRSNRHSKQKLYTLSWVGGEKEEPSGSPRVEGTYSVDESRTFGPLSRTHRGDLVVCGDVLDIRQETELRVLLIPSKDTNPNTFRHVLTPRAPRE